MQNQWRVKTVRSSTVLVITAWLYLVGSACFSHAQSFQAVNFARIDKHALDAPQQSQKVRSKFSFILNRICKQ